MEEKQVLVATITYQYVICAEPSKANQVAFEQLRNAISDARQQDVKIELVEYNEKTKPEGYTDYCYAYCQNDYDAEGLKTIGQLIRGNNGN